MTCRDCGTIENTGCLCAVQDTDCFSITGNGEDIPYGVEPIFDPDADNLLSCSEDGLLGALPTYILDPPAVNVYSTVDIPIAHDTATTVNFDGERYDTDGMHSLVTNTNRLTIVTAGLYVITLNVEWNKNADGDRAAFIRKNGVEFIAYDSKHAGDADLFVGHSVCTQDEFAAGDYIDCVVKQDSGVTLNVIVLHFAPTLSAVFRRRAI